MISPERAKIEKSYNRAMDITETLRVVPEQLADKYSAAYRKCYRESAVRTFFSATKSYLGTLRIANRKAGHL